jgi:hypothetical protein
VLLAGGGLLLVAACGGHGQQPAPAARPAPSLAPSPTPSPSPRPAPAADAAASWWHPAGTGPDHGPEFQWELDHPLSTGSTEDMGDRARNAAGQFASRPTVYDIDGIENSAATVTALHRLGDKVICYVEIGAAGNYYPTADEGIPVSYYAQLKAAGDLGRKVAGYPEYYLNVNAASTFSIVAAMIRKQCAAKGFDAVEPDIDDSYTDSTGYKITEAANEAYDKKLGAYVHRLGLAWGQKNGDNDPAFSAALEPATDFLLTEECSFYRTCGIVAAPYVRAGKLVLDAEYTADWGASTAVDLRRFCASSGSGGMDGTLFSTALSGRRNPCR